jgi:hypothetical protein
MIKRVLVLPLVVAGGLAAAAPAGAAGPSAQASGGDVPPPLPSLVQTRLTRLDKALEVLTQDVNDGNAAHAAKSGKVVRRQLWAAWRGAKYYIIHAPPPPAAARVHKGRTGVRVRDLPPKVRAKISGGAVVPTIADPVTTAMGVFDEFHNVTSTIVELTDGARVPLLDAMSRTLFLSLDRRDLAIQDVHTLAPPVPAAAKVRAHASGGAVVGTFDTVMPGYIASLDDELQHIDGLQSDAPDLRPGGKRILTKARAQITGTENIVNTYWPPLPAAG